MTEANGIDGDTLFDQDLYDRVMNDPADIISRRNRFRSYSTGYENAAKAAARLAAERQAAQVPSDNRLSVEWTCCGGQEYWPLNDHGELEMTHGEMGLDCDGIALTAPGNALEVPSGWSMSSIADCQESDDEGEVIRTYYDCELYRERDGAEVSTTGPTWQAALRNAIAQANEENTDGHN